VPPLTQPIRFHLDPLCPWCYQTSRWVRQLEELGFYAALGAAVHERGADVDDHEVLAGALREAGLDPGLLERALADPATWQQVQDEHDAMVARHKGFGVPTIVLDGGEGGAIFGPVISEVPDDAEAVELWRHVSWLAGYENFAELKRERARMPELASVRRYRKAA